MSDNGKIIKIGAQELPDNICPLITTLAPAQMQTAVGTQIGGILLPQQCVREKCALWRQFNDGPDGNPSGACAFQVIAANLDDISVVGHVVKN